MDHEKILVCLGLPEGLTQHVQIRLTTSIRLRSPIGYTALMRLLLLYLAAVSLLLSSCHQATGPAVDLATQGTVAKIDSAADESDGRLIEETWDAYSMQG